MASWSRTRTCQGPIGISFRVTPALSPIDVINVNASRWDRKGLCGATPIHIPRKLIVLGACAFGPQAGQPAKQQVGQPALLGRRLPDAHVGSADRLVCYVADCRVGTPGRFEQSPFGIRICFGFRDSDFGFGCGCAGPLPGDHHQKGGVPVVRTRMASNRCHSVWPSR
jgi:hypothetical protein